MSVYRFKSPSLNQIDEFAFSTSMHYYKRNLSPVQEYGSAIIATSGIGVSPYNANSQEYKGNIVNKAFKDNMIKNLGTKTICTV